MKGIFGVVGILDEWKKDDLPGNQMVYIVLNDCSRLKNGAIALTDALSSVEEVDFEVDLLIKDLCAVRKKAKEKIKKTNERIRSSL